MWLWLNKFAKQGEARKDKFVFDGGALTKP